MDHLELLDGGLFAESSLLDDIPAQKLRSADLADLPMSAAGGMPVPIALKVDVGQIVTACTNAYRDVAVNQEIQRTEREKVRQLARIQIAQIEADTPPNKREYIKYDKNTPQERHFKWTMSET